MTKNTQWMDECFETGPDQIRWTGRDLRLTYSSGICEGGTEGMHEWMGG